MKRRNFSFYAMFIVMAIIPVIFFISCGKISSVTLDKTTLTLSVGASETLKFTVDPADADYTATWKSSNDKVATVNNQGKVTAISPGSAIITITVENQKATCNVTVTDHVYYIEYDGKKYGLANGFWEIAGMTTWDGINYSQITVASKEVTYNPWLDDISGTGNGMRIKITHNNSFTSISGSQTYTFGDSGEPDHIFTASLLFNHDFWLSSSSNDIEVAGGTLTLSKSSSTYTLNFTGQDRNGKSIKMYFQGYLQKLDSAYGK